MSVKRKIIDISSIGITDLIGTGTAAIFWFYIASELGPESYGEISFFVSIAALGCWDYSIWIQYYTDGISC